MAIEGGIISIPRLLYQMRVDHSLYHEKESPLNYPALMER
jgi:hypothetical protein